ncbi:hypothetical protein DV711_08745 [Motiliproteus coralliicola]|uniref:Uncharacterized protein n=1 Tax=Motiliproteus coralliicola TaxID=2283196 RepID=A0A369WNL9_9GAMM|nr:hypothetical protein [Motiliproteus coralliicola]RDE22659.1 hypothetical protein DV711_08745 [Motiliproteus coralliicola]
MSPKQIIMIGIGVVVLAIAGVAGYFISIEVEKVHSENVESLADFGSKVIPMSSGPDGATYGLEDGQVQLPPSIQEKKLSPTEKVILALSRDKDELLVEVTKLEHELGQLSVPLKELRSYQAENERFAPERLTEERVRAQSILREYFDTSSDVAEFSRFQRQAVHLASANLFTEIVRANGLILFEEVKDQLIKLLPSYGLCLGENLPFVTNNRAEEIQILQALSDDGTDSLTGNLGQDYQSIHLPCLKALNRQVDELLKRSDLDPAKVVKPTQKTGERIEHVQAEPVVAPMVVTSASAADGSPTNQLISSLESDKAQLLARVISLKQQLEDQTKELAELEQYRQGTERYAPLPIAEERKRAHEILNQLFEQLRETNRFSNFQKQAMSLAAANHYAAFSRKNRLILNEQTKDEIINNLLTRYAFCFADNLKFVIDNALSERQLLNALREQDLEYMPPALQRTVAEFTQPCAEQLDQQLQAYL